MHKRPHFLLLAAVLACANASASDYLLVVPVKGRAAAPAAAPKPDNISVSLSAGALPAGMVAMAYSYSLADRLLVTGDPALALEQAQWSAAGPLPGGLSLSASGVLTGTPTSAGPTSIQATVSYKSKSASQTFSLAIDRLVYQLGFEQGWASSDGTGVANTPTITLSSAVVKDGATSLRSAPTGTTAPGRVEYPAGAGMQFGTGDFTFEAWAYRTAANADASAGIASLIADKTVQLLVDDVVPQGGAAIAYPAFDIGGVSYGTKAVAVPLNQWMKYTLVRRSGKVRFYVNDVLMPISTYSPSAPNNYTDATVTELSVPAAINPTGLWVANRGTLNRQWRGYVDGLRISPD